MLSESRDNSDWAQCLSFSKRGVSSTFWVALWPCLCMCLEKIMKWICESHCIMVLRQIRALQTGQRSGTAHSL